MNQLCLHHSRSRLHLSVSFPGATDGTTTQCKVHKMYVPGTRMTHTRLEPYKRATRLHNYKNHYLTNIIHKRSMSEFVVLESEKRL